MKRMQNLGMSTKVVAVVAVIVAAIIVGAGAYMMVGGGGGAGGAGGEENKEKCFRVGFIGPIESSFAKAAYRYTMCAIQQYRQKYKGTEGYPSADVKMVAKYDTAQKPSEAVSAYKRLVAKDVDLIISGCVDDTTLALQGSMKKSRVPTITQWTSAWESIKRCYEDNIYNYFMTEDYDLMHTVLSIKTAKAVSNQLVKKGYPEPGFEDTIIFAEETSFGHGCVQGYKQNMSKYTDYEILNTYVVNPKTDDYGPIFSEIQKQNPDYLSTAIATRDLPPVNQWAGMDWACPMIGTIVSPASAFFWKDTGGAPAAEGWHGLIPYKKSQTSQMAWNSWHIYKEKYGMTRPFFMGYGFHAYMSFLQAMKAADDANGFWDTKEHESSYDWAKAMEDVTIKTYNAKTDELWNRYSFYEMGEMNHYTDVQASHNWKYLKDNGVSYFKPQYGIWTPESVEGGINVPVPGKSGKLRIIFPPSQVDEGFWWPPSWGPISEQ